MANKTLLRIALAVLVIAGLAVGYAQYRAVVTSAEEAALKAEAFAARNAIDARQADPR